MAGKYTFVADQGSKFDRILTWTNAAGTAYDLTGWTAKMEIRTAAGGTLLQTLQTSDSTIVLGGVAGTIRLVVGSAVTVLWTWASGVYDLELTDTTTEKTRLIQGNFVVSPEVTQ